MVGFARRRLRRAAVTALVAVSIALAACGGSASDPATTTPTAADTPATATAPSATEAPTAPPATDTETPTPDSNAEATESPTDAPAADTPATEALAGTFAAWGQVESLRMKMTMPSPENPEDLVSLTVEMVRPDRMRVVTEAAEGTFEMIMIGDTTYMKMGDSWMTLPGSQSLDELGAVAPDDTIDEVGAPGVTAVQRGTETIDGVRCTVWDLTIPDDEGGTLTARMWIGADDNLPRLMTIETPEGTMTMEYSGYDGDIVIEPPV